MAVSNGLVHHHTSLLFGNGQSTHLYRFSLSYTPPRTSAIPVKSFRPVWRLFIWFVPVFFPDSTMYCAANKGNAAHGDHDFPFNPLNFTICYTILEVDRINSIEAKTYGQIMVYDYPAATPA